MPVCLLIEFEALFPKGCDSKWEFQPFIISLVMISNVPNMDNLKFLIYRYNMGENHIKLQKKNRAYEEVKITNHYLLRITQTCFFGSILYYFFFARLNVNRQAPCLQEAFSF